MLLGDNYIPLALPCLQREKMLMALTALRHNLLLYRGLQEAALWHKQPWLNWSQAVFSSHPGA